MTVFPGEVTKPKGIPCWRLVFDAGIIPPDVAAHHHKGSGTEKDPFQVIWIENDARNPMNFGIVHKWMITVLMAINSLAVALVSSAYSGSLIEVIDEFQISEELAIVGISLFVVGFAVGPLVWAPLSELYGRRQILIASSAGLAAFTAGCAGAQNIWSLLILRFFAGSLGSAPFAVAGAVIADCFPPINRGLASGLYSAALLLGPTLGPIIGGFLSESAGWRWVEGLVAAFAGFLGILILCFLPETFAPTLLNKRAARLSATTGHVYRSKVEIDDGKKKPAAIFKVALSRPWVLLVREPIVLLLSIYLAIIYGILYLLFAAMPIVYQTERGWGEGLGGLSFLGITIGILFAAVATFPLYFNYRNKTLAAGTRLAPEQRLPGAMIGSIALPVGLFWFAWTNSPSIHWMVSIAAGVPLGFGMVMVFLPIVNYLIDTYTIYAASVMAANTSLRSIFGAVFPLFTTYMYKDLGIHWASSVPAFLAVACVPMPFLFYRYGPGIRKRCHYAATSQAFMEKLYERTALPAKIEREDPTDTETLCG